MVSCAFAKGQDKVQRVIVREMPPLSLALSQEHYLFFLSSSFSEFKYSRDHIAQ
jgi:hypothetical protein